MNYYTEDTLHYWENFWNNNSGLGSSNYDPDILCKTMQLDQQKAWSKPLPNGEVFALKLSSTDYLTWNGMRFGSDSIVTSFRWQKNRNLIERVAGSVDNYRAFVEDFLRRTYTIGGEIIFPKHRNSINQKRGTNQIICDRFDITLECIRKYFLKEESPLTKVLESDKEFFDLFVNFEGYIKFFCLEDLVSDDYSAIKFWDDWKEFEDNPIPQSVEDYLKFLEKEVEFVENRNRRIASQTKN